MDRAPISLPVGVRPAARVELEALDGLVARAKATWALSPRVRRLSASLYRVDEAALLSFDVRVAEAADARLVGLSMLQLEAHRLDDGTDGADALWLHGLFVEPAAWRGGIGTALVADAVARARALGRRRVDLRARPEAIGFFERLGFRPIPRADESHAMSLALA